MRAGGARPAADPGGGQRSAGDARHPRIRQIVKGGQVRNEAPAWRIERLGVFLRLIGPQEAEEQKLLKAIEQAGRRETIPKGVGPLTFEESRRDVGDWARFNDDPEHARAPRSGCASYHVAIAAQQWRPLSSRRITPPDGAHPCGAAFGWLPRSSRLRPVPAQIHQWRQTKITQRQLV